MYLKLIAGIRSSILIGLLRFLEKVNYAYASYLIDLFMCRPVFQWLHHAHYSVCAAKCLTLLEAVISILPEYFSAIINKEPARVCIEDGQKDSPEDASYNRSAEDQAENTPEHVESCASSSVVIKLLRIQGIEPKFEIPFSWVVNNLMNPEYFLHICVHIKVSQVNTI